MTSDAQDLPDKHPLDGFSSLDGLPADLAAAITKARAAGVNYRFFSETPSKYREKAPRGSGTRVAALLGDLPPPMPEQEAQFQAPKEQRLDVPRYLLDAGLTAEQAREAMRRAGITYMEVGPTSHYPEGWVPEFLREPDQKAEAPSTPDRPKKPSGG